MGASITKPMWGSSKDTVVSKFTNTVNTVKEHFNENSNVRHITVILILVLIGFILYYLLTNKKE